MRVTKVLCALLLFGPLAVEANEATESQRSNLPLTAVDSDTGRDVRGGATPVNGQALAQTATEKGAGAKDRNTGVPVANRPAMTSNRLAIIPSPAATPQQIGRTNADRLRSLLATQARGRVVRQPVSHTVDAARAPTFIGGAAQPRLGANATQLGAGPAQQRTWGAASPAALASLSAGRPAPTLSAARPAVTLSPGRPAPTLSAARPAPTLSPGQPVPTLSALAIHSTNGLPRAPGLAVVDGRVVGSGVHNSSIDGTRLRRKF